MNRSYDRHYLRENKTLNGSWNIIFDPNDEGVSKGYFSKFPQQSESIWVPSCWNYKFGRYNYDDIAWCHRIINVSDSGCFYLTFDAVSGQKKAWVDGELLGEHYGSFSEFSFLIRDLQAGQHDIVVRIDNRHDDYTLPKVLVDWKIWGGIYRSVTIAKVKDVVIDRVFIDPIWDDYKVKKLSVRVRLVNCGQGEYKLPGAIFFDDKQLWQGEITVPSDGGDIELGQFDPGNVELWSIDNPRLYSLRVVCGSDDMVERTGFRKIEKTKNRILINGEPVKIKGINRHHTHDAHGFAITPDLLERDMDIIQNAGITGIRGSHYPNEPLVHDFCDERGLLFTEEMPFWGHEAESLGNPLFQQRALSVLKETIERDYNHPSIILWSLQNESGSDTPEGCELFGKMSKLARSLDSSRLITYSTDRPYKDICQEHVDVIGVNRYMGWYEGDKEDWPAEIKRLKNYFEEKGYGDKLLMLTEFGACAFLGDRGFEIDRKYSEEFQAEYLEYVLNCLLDDDEIAGMYIWQYCDMRTSKRKGNPGRPRCYNTKGIVDEHRRPKLAYETVKKCYLQR